MTANGNGWLKRMGMILPIAGALFYLLKTAYTVGQTTQAMADELKSLNTKVCLVEGDLRITDQTCH